MKYYYMRENSLKLFDGLKIHSAMTAITAMKMFTLGLWYSQVLSTMPPSVRALKLQSRQASDSFHRAVLPS